MKLQDITSRSTRQQRSKMNNRELFEDCIKTFTDRDEPPHITITEDNSGLRSNTIYKWVESDSKNGNSITVDWSRVNKSASFPEELLDKFLHHLFS